MNDKFNPENIINMDETSVYLDFPSNYTFELKGAKKVSVVTTAGERTRLSAAFSATAAGNKLPILTVIPRKTNLANFQKPNNVELVYKTGGTFNEDVIFTYLTTIDGN